MNDVVLVQIVSLSNGLWRVSLTEVTGEVSYKDFGSLRDASSYVDNFVKGLLE